MQKNDFPRRFGIRRSCNIFLQGEKKWAIKLVFLIFFNYWNSQIARLTGFLLSHCVMSILCKYGILFVFCGWKKQFFCNTPYFLKEVIAIAVCDTFIFSMILRHIDKIIFCARLFVGIIWWWPGQKNNLKFVLEIEKRIIQISMTNISSPYFAQFCLDLWLPHTPEDRFCKTEALYGLYMTKNVLQNVP